MVFVYTNAIESELFGVDQFVQVAVVCSPADLRVVEFVGACDPRRPIVVVRERGVGHEMEVEESHASKTS